MQNHTIVRHLLDAARQIEKQGGNLYRIRAYRQAAINIMGLDQEIEDLLKEGGKKALREVPGVGQHLAETIDELVCTGEIESLYEELVLT